MRLTPYENLKGFAHSKPPLMVFMACLGFFAVVLMSLGYYVKLTESITDPDITKDWNEFLKRFSKLEFCIQHNINMSDTAAQVSTKPPNVPTMKGVTTNSLLERDVGSLEEDFTRNYSLTMQLTVIPTKEFIQIPHNVTHITGTVTGDMIGLMGQLADEEITVTMELPFEWTNTKCGAITCEEINFYACVLFQAPNAVFPRTTSPGVCESMNDTGIDFYTTMMPQLTTNMYSSHYCRQRSTIRMRPDIDRTFTVYLSLSDRSVINLHLMHTSYFLFVMVVTVLCYALLRGRPLKSKVTQTEMLLASASTEA